MDRGAWWAIVHGLTKSWTQRSDLHLTFNISTWMSVWRLSQFSRVPHFATPWTVEKTGVNQCFALSRANTYSINSTHSLFLYIYTIKASNTSVLKFSQRAFFLVSKHFEIFAESETKLVIHSLRNIIDFPTLARLQTTISSASHIDHCNNSVIVPRFNQVSSPSTCPKITASYFFKIQILRSYFFTKNLSKLPTAFV